MLICPRCERPLSPDHRCLSRRHFFFGLAGSVALAAASWPWSQTLVGRPELPLSREMIEQAWAFIARPRDRGCYYYVPAWHPLAELPPGATVRWA